MKLLIVSWLCLLTCMLSAWEPFMVISLQRNIADQIKYVMPHRPLHYSAVNKVEFDQPFSVEMAVVLREKSVKPLDFRGTLTLTSPQNSVKTLFKDVPLRSLAAEVAGVYPLRLKPEVCFEKDDPCGKYRFELTLYDDSGEVQKIAREVQLVTSITDNTAVTVAEMSEILHNYYKDPRPDKFFAVWHCYMEKGVVEQQKKEGRNFNPSAMLLSFCEILKINPQFQDDFALLSRSAPVECHAYYAFVIAGLNKEFLEKYRSAINPDILVLTNRLGGQDPFEIKDVTEAFHLDMLWAEFFITGKFEPIKKLASQLRSLPGMSIQEAKQKIAAGQQLTAEEKQMLFNRVVQVATLWSMRSNIKSGKHNLLAFYLETIVKRKLYTDKNEGSLIISVFENNNSQQEKKE